MNNDTVVYCCIKKPGTKDEWEELANVAGEVFEYEYPAKSKPEEKKRVEEDS